MARRRDLAVLLTERIRLHPKAVYDADEKVLWVRRRNPFERLAARLVQKGEPRVRLALDEKSAKVLHTLADLGAPSGRALAEAVGTPADQAALEARDPELAALLVFLETLRRGGAIVTEPI